jgi:hypothetical protein
MADFKTIKYKGSTITGVPSDVRPGDPRIEAFMSSITEPGTHVFAQTPTTQRSAYSGATALTPQNMPSAQRQGTVIPPTALEQAGGDFKEGLDATIRGAVPLATAEIVSTPIVSAINKTLGTNYDTPAESMRAMLESIGIDAPESAQGRLIETLSEVVLETAATFGVGTALQGAKLLPSAMKGVGNVLTAEAGSQLTGGLGAATASQLAAEADAPVPVQLAAGLAGGVLGGQLPNIKKATVPRVSKAPLKEAEDLGVDLMTSDVIKPDSFITKWGQSMGEKIPLTGTGGQRARQQTQRMDAIKKTLEEFGADDIDNLPENIIDDLLSTREAKRLTSVDKKWDVINKLTDSEVPTDNTMGLIDETLARLERQNLSDTMPIRNKLESWKEAIQNKDLSDIEDIRSTMREAYKSTEFGGVPTKAQSTFNKVYNSLNDDMGKYIKDVGGDKDFTKWKVANTDIAKSIGELKNTALKKTLNSAETKPEQVIKMLLSKDKSDVELLYKELSPRGRASARSAILAEAANKAQQAGGDISPERFVNSVKKLGNQTGIFFQGEDLKQIEGLTRVLDATRRASGAKVMTPTGQQAVPYLAAGGAAKAAEMLGLQGTEGIIAGATLLLGTGGMARIYESKPVRNILVKLATSKPGSPGEAEILRILTETVKGLKAKETKQERNIPKE